MLRDATGNKLFRKVQVKITFPDAIFPPKVLTQHAGPHQGFGPSGIGDILMQTADQLDTLYPFWDFRMLELAPEGRTARYSFSFAGYRSAKVSDGQDNPKESNTLELGTAESLAAATVKSVVANPRVVPLSQE